MTKGKRPQLICRVGIGCGSPESIRMAESHIKLGHTVISADDIRSEKAKLGLTSFNVRQVLIAKVMEALGKGNNVYVDSDHSTKLSKIIMTGVAASRGADLDFVHLLQKEADLIKWINTARGEELEQCLPWYFTHHPVLYQNHPPGAERGRRVAFDEIKRHIADRYTADVTGLLVPSGKFF